MIANLCATCRIKARVFSYAFQVYALMPGQLSGAFSLNEICDAMVVHCKKLFRVQGLLPARCNTFSNANRTRDPAVAEKLFWKMYRRLTSLVPKFVHPKHKRRLPKNVLSDETIRLTGVRPSKSYPQTLRRIRARVEVDGKMLEMVFMTNNFEWSAATVADRYRARWQVELLFKELKQTLQMKDFYGENANAVAWQVWTAILVHLLLRYLAYCSSWSMSHTRFSGVVRVALWERTDWMERLKTHGTAPRLNPPKNGRFPTSAKTHGSPPPASPNLLGFSSPDDRFL